MSWVVELSWFLEQIFTKVVCMVQPKQEALCGLCMKTAGINYKQDRLARLSQIDENW